MCAQWAEDALKIKFAWTKNDKEGTRETSFHERHVYSNPGEPAVCAISSLARYLSCFGFTPDQKYLFHGREGTGQAQYNR